MNKKTPPTVNRARLQLMLAHPFMAAATARYPLVNASEYAWCDTMATDGYFIYVDSDFCTQLTEEEIIGVLAHELMHCVLGHIDRRGERHRLVWNMAIDFATNQLLVDSGFKLPKGALLEYRYRGQTAEGIYKQLFDEISDKSPELLVKGNGNADGKGPTEQGAGEGEGRLKSWPGGDSHLDPGDTEGAAHRQEDYPTEIERRRIRVSLANDLISQLPGRAAGHFAEEVQSANTSHISWQSILARFFNGLRRSDYSMFPPNKKHAWRGIFLPSIGVPGPDHIVVAVDTSGSMRPKDLGMALAEIDRLRVMTECKLTLIECDTKIQHVESFEPWEASHTNFKSRKFHGRGGTDMKPPFEWVETNLCSHGEWPDAIFYMTDGYGGFPNRAPPFGVFWVAPKHGKEEFPFGDVIRLPST